MADRIVIHNEPDCDGDNGCNYQEPHHHGLACDVSCRECRGDCHFDCPANFIMREGEEQMAQEGKLGPEEIENRFGFHKATIEGDNATLPKHTELRLAFREIAEYLDDVLPKSRAKSTAFTELENASMWAHKAIAEEAPLVSEEAEVS